MTKAVTLSRTTLAALHQCQIDLASSAIVLACGAALILAGQPFPG